MHAVAGRLTDAFAKDPPARYGDIPVADEIDISLDIGLAIDTYIFSRERTIPGRPAAIQDCRRRCSQIREGLLLVPIIGLLGLSRAPAR